MDGMAKRRRKTHTHQQLLRQRCADMRITTMQGLLSGNNVSNVEGVGTDDTIVLIGSLVLGDLHLGDRDLRME
ncbi:hypothetical protein DEO72_LG3g1238 [Vigna unguiculata]|uniref:Uncharacterized protein n=1 Tax=Vigna unguiculata TaxID=3917 RepID=A0A4D6LDZ0_VIGUN|nr:hypothetical protein DEO72_LG3g1238 [Vigna unguiculata]